MPASYKVCVCVCLCVCVCVFVCVCVSILEQLQQHKRTREKFSGKYWQDVPVSRLRAIRLFSWSFFFPVHPMAENLNLFNTNKVGYTNEKNNLTVNVHINGQTTKYVFYNL